LVETASGPARPAMTRLGRAVLVTVRGASREKDQKMRSGFVHKSISGLLHD
jgi:hypothetical protein